VSGGRRDGSGRAGGPNWTLWEVFAEEAARQERSTVSERVEHLPSAPGCDGSSWSAHCSCGWSSWGHVSQVGAWQAESAHRVRVGVDSAVGS
jgi:hypothetical protein